MPFKLSLPADASDPARAADASADASAPGSSVSVYSAKALQVAMLIEQWSRAAQLDVRAYRRIVEFGGGTTQLACTLANGGFAGEHIIYDLLPMAMMQRYFLRLGGVAAALALEPGSALSAPGVVTLSTEVDVLRALLLHRPPPPKANHAAAASHATSATASEERSAFVATWSLTESPRELREEVLSVVKDSVTDYFIVWPSSSPSKLLWEDRQMQAQPVSDRWIPGGNFAWVRHAIREGMLGAANRSGCVWKPISPFKTTVSVLGTYYLVASAVERVRCDPAAGCTDETRVACW